MSGRLGGKPPDGLKTQYPIFGFLVWGGSRCVKDLGDFKETCFFFPFFFLFFFFLLFFHRLRKAKGWSMMLVCLRSNEMIEKSGWRGWEEE